MCCQNPNWIAELPAEATRPKTSLAILSQIRPAIYLLFAQFRPEVWGSEDFLEENVGLRSSAWPFIELIENSHIAMIVSDWLHNEDGCAHGVHSSLPILVGRVVGRGLPVAHYRPQRSNRARFTYLYA